MSVGGLLAGELPDGYEALEYVESTGRQCIDTGVKPSPATRVVCDCQFTSTDIPQRSGVSAGKTIFLWGVESSPRGKFGSIVNPDWNTRGSSGVDVNLNRHTFDLKSGSQSLDGVEYARTAFTDTASLSIWLFGGHADYSVDISDACKMRVYACQIYEGGTLVRDYVPAMDPNGRIGLYDFAQRQFTAPAIGFLVAARKPRLPEGYTLLEYVESTGGQWLDTGVCADADTRVQCDCQFTATTAPQRCGSAKGGSVFLWGLESGLNGRFGSIYSSTWVPREDTGVPGDCARHMFDLTSGTQRFDGKRYATAAFTDASSIPLYLFGADDDSKDASYRCSMKLYACEICSGATIVRNYVPAADPMGRVGLYDLVEKRFVAPAAGTLRARYAPTLPEGYSLLEYAESDGTQYVDTGVYASSSTRVVCDCAFTRTDVQQRNGVSKGDSTFLWGLESAYQLRFGSIVYPNWNQREDSGVAGDCNRHTFDLKCGAQRLDGVRYGTHAFSETATVPLWLFGTDDGRAAPSYACSMRLYNCQVYDGDTLVRNYVPAADPMGRVGVFDLVAGNFVRPLWGVLRTRMTPVLPAGYEALEYVESDGSQHLDTGIYPSALTRLTCDCAFTKTGTAQRNGASSAGIAFLWGLESAYENRFGSIFNASWNPREDSGRNGDTNRHVFDLCSGSQVLDGQEYGTHTFAATSSRTLWLFAGHVDYQVEPFSPCSMRLYACQIRDGGRLVRDYVPARDSSGTVGLFDVVSGTFTVPLVGTLTGGALSPSGRADLLVVKGTPHAFGNVSPAYGEHGGFSVGERVTCTAPAAITNVEEGTVAVCTGYAVTADGTVCQEGTFDDGEARQFVYVHPSCANGAVLAWRWQVTYQMPKGMTEIEYAEFSGGTYVDTGVAMIDHELRFSYYPTANVNGANVVGQSTGWYYVHWSVYDSRYSWGLSGSQGSADVASWTQARHDVVFDRTGDHAIVLDGKVLASGAPATSNGGGVLIGGRGADRLFQGRVYSLEMIDHATGTKALDLVPVMDVKGRVGFYDRISARFILPSAGELSYVTEPFAWVAHSHRCAEGMSAVSCEGSLPLTASEPFTVTVRRSRIYDKKAHQAYVCAGWRLVVAHADGNMTETVSGDDNRGTCTFVPSEGDRVKVMWQWAETDPSGLLILVR